MDLDARRRHSLAISALCLESCSFSESILFWITWFRMGPSERFAVSRTECLQLELVPSLKRTNWTKGQEQLVCGVGGLDRFETNSSSRLQTFQTSLGLQVLRNFRRGSNRLLAASSRNSQIYGTMRASVALCAAAGRSDPTEFLVLISALLTSSCTHGGRAEKSQVADCALIMGRFIRGQGAAKLEHQALQPGRAQRASAAGLLVQEIRGPTVLRCPYDKNPII